MKSKTIISCFYNGENKKTLPLGFSWGETLLKLFPNKYKITLLLHGECLKYGLNNEAFCNNFKRKNPYKKFLKKLVEKGVQIVICEYCLTQDGFTNCELLKFVKPITFSVDYLAQAELKGKAVIYDAKLNKN